MSVKTIQLSFGSVRLNSTMIQFKSGIIQYISADTITLPYNISNDDILSANKKCKEVFEDELYEKMSYNKSVKTISPLRNKVLRNIIKKSFENKNFSGFVIQGIIGDGNCQYRSIAHQIYNDESRYQDIKNAMKNTLAKNINTFMEETKITPDDSEDSIMHSLNYYMEDKNWGDNFTLQAIAETFKDYCITVYISCKVNNLYKLKIKYQFPEQNFKHLNPINLYFHNNNHYSSLIKI